MGKLASGGKLSAREADELRPQLVEAIMSSGDTLDDVLTQTNANRRESDIWDLDAKDADTLADALLMLGRKSGLAAGVVRGVAQGYISLRALGILGPRIWRTAKWYPDNGGFKL